VSAAGGRRSSGRAEYVIAVILDVVGAGSVLLMATRSWQTIVTPRPRPFTDDVLVASGRTIDAAPTALALVALAGVVAVLATGGVMRRAIGALIAVAGVGLVGRTARAMSAVDAAQARRLVRAKHPRVSFSSNAVPHVSTHPVWAALCIASGVLVVVGGLLIAVRGGRWGAMSSRYEAPGSRTDPGSGAVAGQRADVALWGALDRGEDPTARDPREAE
jgi:uncharacterized membrane protein (TIGR02234 family)